MSTIGRVQPGQEPTSEQPVDLVCVGATDLSSPDDKRAYLLSDIPPGINLLGTAKGELPLSSKLKWKLRRNIWQFAGSRRTPPVRANHELGVKESEQRSRSIDRALSELDSQDPLILMMQLMFDPDPRNIGRRYVIWTDWTFALRIKQNQHDRDVRKLDSTSELFQFESRVARRAAHVFAYNEVCRDSFVNDYGVNPSKATVLGTPSRMVSPEPHAQFSELQPTALFIGLDFHRKGGDTLLEAWPAVRAAIPEARLIICGPLRVPDLPDGVEMRGRQARAEVQQAFLESTLFVVPSREDPHPIVIGEAFGHGLPVISTRGTGGAEKRIKDHENGLLVDPESPDQLAAAMIELLSNPESSWAMGNSARDEILETSTPHAVLERMLPELRRAAAEH